MNIRISLALVTVTGLAGTARGAAESRPATTQPAPGFLQGCFAHAPDFSPIYPTRVVPARNGELFAVLQLGQDESYEKLTYTWTKIEKRGAVEREVSQGTGELQMLKRFKKAWVRRRPPGGLDPGLYRVSVQADGAPWKSFDFEVVEGQAVKYARPEQVVPLTPGSKWTYAFTLQPGPGTKMTIANLKPDEAGAFHFPALWVAADASDTGTHLLIDAPGFGGELWMKWTSHGLTLFKRTTGEEEIVAFDPPQTIFPWPLKVPSTWTYQSKDGKAMSSYNVWGPVPVKGQKAEGLGYVVLETKRPRGAGQPGMSGPGFFQETIESHYLPGVGLVRQITVEALNDTLTARQEMVLVEAQIAKAAGAETAGPSGEGPATPGGETGIQLTVAPWVPPRDTTYGWWGAVPAGESPQKPTASTKTDAKLRLDPGAYDVYWVQDYDVRGSPLLLAENVEVKDGRLATVSAEAGIQLEAASWVPARDATYGWWGAVKAGEKPDKPVNWTKTASAILLPPGRYDVYWVQDYDTRRAPLLVAANLKVKAGQAAKVRVESGLRLEAASWVPARDATYGWWGAVKAGDKPDNLVNWTKAGAAIVLTPGRYDVYWVQDYETRSRPMLLASSVEVKAGAAGTIMADSGIRLKAPQGTAPLDASYGWWGAVRTGGKADERVNWSKGDFARALLLPPGTYDLYWKQDYKGAVQRIKERVLVTPGGLAEVEVDPGQGP